MGILKCALPFLKRKCPSTFTKDYSHEEKGPFNEESPFEEVEIVREGKLKGKEGGTPLKHM